MTDHAVALAAWLLAVSIAVHLLGVVWGLVDAVAALALGYLASWWRLR